MGRPILIGCRGWETPVLFEDRNASLDALVTDIYGRAGHKPSDLISAPVTERAAQTRRRPRPEQPHDPRKLGQTRHPLHIHDSRRQNTQRASLELDGPRRPANRAPSRPATEDDLNWRRSFRPPRP